MKGQPHVTDYLCQSEQLSFITGCMSPGLSRSFVQIGSIVEECDGTFHACDSVCPWRPSGTVAVCIYSLRKVAYSTYSSSSSQQPILFTQMPFTMISSYADENDRHSDTERTKTSPSIASRLSQSCRQWWSKASQSPPSTSATHHEPDLEKGENLSSLVAGSQWAPKHTLGHQSDFSTRKMEGTTENQFAKRSWWKRHGSEVICWLSGAGMGTALTMVAETAAHGGFK